MKKYQHIFVLAFIFLLGLFIRLYKIDQTPKSMTWDETSIGYNAYSLLLTGRDEYSYQHPILLRSFDDYKPALYAYLTIPLIKIFGLNIFSVRFISALSGALLIISTYFLCKRIFADRVTAVVAAILVTFSPILILYSRMALETNLSLTLFVSGLALSLSKNSKKSYAFGVSLLLLSCYAYHSTRYVVPPTLLALLYIQRKSKSFRYYLITTLISALFYLPIISYVFSPIINSRFKETSIISNYHILFGSIANLGDTQPLINIVSRLYFYVCDFAGRYLSYFNPYQLFFYATGNPSYRVEGIGILNLIEFPFWLLGVYQLIKNRNKYWLILFLLLIIPIPASVTVDWFSPHRAILIWPLHILLTSAGLTFFINYLRTNRLLRPILTLPIAATFLFYFAKSIESVTIYQPYVNAGIYQYGFADTIPFVKSIESQYSRIIIDSPHAQPHIFFLFYSQYPPDLYQSETAWRSSDFSPRKNFDFGPYTFRKIYWPDDRNLKNTLFIGNTFSLPYDQLKNTPEVNLIKEFTTPDGNISFRVVGTK